jgi:formate dehydrogenase subunit gamma
LMSHILRIKPWLGCMGLVLILSLTDMSTMISGDGNVAFAESPAKSSAIAPTTPGSNVRPPASQKWGEPAALPTNMLPQPSTSTDWGRIRLGAKGKVSIPNKDAGILVQSQGESWRQFRMNDLVVYGALSILGIIIILALFYSTRGTIKISAGRSNKKIKRFSMLDRFTHWLTAVPFCVLALTGLNLIYGKDLILPIIGPEAFSAITTAGKSLHNFMGFAFILGIILMVILWVRHNLWDKYDRGWILNGGGMFDENVHPPAKKFNFGQKIIFWAVVLSGASLSYSGISLMFPFEFSPFAGTFSFLNNFGFDLPTNLEPIQEMQLTQAWHGLLSVLMVALIIAHIYIGTLGMEGAIDAMWDGEVDENWAREHHSAWVAEIKGEPAPEPLTERIQGGSVSHE